MFVYIYKRRTCIPTLQKIKCTVYVTDILTYWRASTVHCSNDIQVVTNYNVYNINETC